MSHALPQPVSQLRSPQHQPHWHSCQQVSRPASSCGANTGPCTMRRPPSTQKPPLHRVSQHCCSAAFPAMLHLCLTTGKASSPQLALVLRPQAPALTASAVRLLPPQAVRHPPALEVLSLTIPLPDACHCTFEPFSLNWYEPFRASGESVSHYPTECKGSQRVMMERGHTSEVAPLDILPRATLRILPIHVGIIGAA